MTLGESEEFARIDLPNNSNDNDDDGRTSSSSSRNSISDACYANLAEFFLDLATEERKKADRIFEFLFNEVEGGLIVAETGRTAKTQDSGKEEEEEALQVLLL